MELIFDSELLLALLSTLFSMLGCVYFFAAIYRGRGGLSKVPAPRPEMVFGFAFVSIGMLLGVLRTMSPTSISGVYGAITIITVSVIFIVVGFLYRRLWQSFELLLTDSAHK